MLINAVAPFAGAWIEIVPIKGLGEVLSKSLPSRERGLKYSCKYCYARSIAVAPFAGAWIEMGVLRQHKRENLVAPFAGAWIEISDLDQRSTAACVAPFAGAWIEIVIMYLCFVKENSRSLRGSVD